MVERQVALLLGASTFSKYIAKRNDGRPRGRFVFNRLALEQNNDFA
jgi:hypothetical protein